MFHKIISAQLSVSQSFGEYSRSITPPCGWSLFAAPGNLESPGSGFSTLLAPDMPFLRYGTRVRSEDVLRGTKKRPRPIALDCSVRLRLRDALSRLSESLSGTLGSPGKNNAQDVTLFKDVDGESVSHVNMTISLNKNEEVVGYIRSVDTLLEHRRKGHATELIKTAHRLMQQEDCIEVTLSVLDNNPSAVALYTKLGYVITENDSGMMEMTLALK